MRRLAVLGVALSGLGCSRSFAPPAPSQPGTLYGTVVVERDAVEGRVPAAGAKVFLAGTSQGTVAGSDGRFLLDGITARTGTLLITFDSDGDGVDDRRTALALEAVHAGPNRQIDLGEIVVARPAAVRGRVRRGDALNDPGDNGGALVFVPQGPASTTTADDGSFTLGNLPAGDVELRVFLPHYAPLSVGTVTLEPGQLMTLSDVVLTPKPGDPGQGTLQVHVDLAPSGALEGTTVSIVGGTQAGATNAQGDAQLGGVTEGVYALSLHHAGYADATVSNVPVFAGQTTSVTSVLGTGQGVPLPDAGVPALPDAGLLNDGSLVVVATDPSSADQDAVFGARVTFNEQVSTASATNPANVQVLDASGNAVPGTLRYDLGSNTVTLTYDAPLAIDAPYSLRVQNVVSAAGQPASLVAPLRLDFTPRKVRWRLFRDPSGTVSVDARNFGTNPQIVWTPQGVHVIARRIGDASCANDPLATYILPEGRFDPLQVAPDGGLFRPAVPACTPDLYDIQAGFLPPQIGAVIDGSPTAAFEGQQSNGPNTTVMQFAGTGWVNRAVATFQAHGALADGASLALAYYDPSYISEVRIYTFDSAGGQLVQQPPGTLGLYDAYTVDQNYVIASGGTADHFFFAVTTTQGSVDWMYRKSSGFGVIDHISDPLPVTALRVLQKDGEPYLLIDSTQATSSIQLVGVDSLPVADYETTRAWGPPLAADATFDAALLGRTAYVVSALGGVTLHHYVLDGGNGTWDPDDGPNAGAISEPNGCVARDPSIAAGDTSLWIAWSEGCALPDAGTGFQSVVREAY